MQVLSFSSAEQLYCCELQYVVRVIKVVALKILPGAPPYLKGLMDYYSTQVPVIDFIQSLDSGIKPTYTLDTPLIVIACKGEMMGLIVDEVHGVAVVDEAQLKPIPSVAKHAEIKGSVYINESPALYVDLAVVVSKHAEGVIGETANR